MEDAYIRRLVEDELSDEPSVDAAGIGVAVHDGVVTLTGHVDSLADFHDAQQAVLRVNGVRGIANDIEVRPSNGHQRNDEDIALDAVKILGSTAHIPSERLKVTVHKGEVTLDGEVDWWYQGETASKLVRSLIGVRRLMNHISVRKRPVNGSVKKQIKTALERTAISDPDRITVETTAERVTLNGTVHAWWERDEAERIAWSVRGVCQVSNNLAVEPLSR
jgi:osmotically-inducible protein OsmY